MSSAGGRRRRGTSFGAILVALALGLAGLGVSFNVTATPAGADTQPVDPNLPETVSAAALPTVQINGVVWGQVIVGNRVYVTGQFTSARPAGAPPGTDETPRENLLAYDLTTGELIPSWAPTLNQQGLVIRASADGSTIYVGGDFDQANGQWIGRVAAFDAQTGALVPGFNPQADTRVRALAVNGNTLYIGGYFTTLGGEARSHLGAVNATTGALLPWAPVTDREVVSMVVHPASGRVIVGGNFNTINGSTQLGMGSVDGVTGAVMPWAANQTIQNHNSGVEISSLVTDGQQIYGSGWTYLTGGGTGNLEGVFAADPLTGAINWIDAGRGDTYELATANGVIYDVGHHHDWGMLDWNPQTLPDWEFQRTDAIDTRRSPTLTNAYGTNSLWNYFPGTPAAQPLHWLPTLTGGTYTGQGQAAWSVQTNGDYVVEGGEFPKVNGIDQQGLVRFAKRTIAGTNVDPIQKYTELTPTLTATSAGTVRVAWTAAWDRDNSRIKVEVLRGDTTATSTVLETFDTTDTTWWNRPPLAFYDTTAPAGTTQTYRIRVTDPFGNGFAGPPASITIPVGSPAASTYADRVMSDNPSWFWRMGETSGTLARDRSGSNDLTLNSSDQRNAAGALLNQADPAVSFPGTSSTSTVQGASPFWESGPQTFSLEAWVKTTTSSGGKIIGFGNSNTGRSDSNNTDRHIYMNNSGQFYFGVRPDMGTRETIHSPSSYRDGQWHQVVGTLDGSGMKLYVDGNLVANNASVTKAQVYRGYWRVGGDRLSSWPSAPSREAIAATIDEVAVYPKALSLGHIRAHYLASGRTTSFPNINPVAEFTSSAQYHAATFTSTSTDDDGTISTYLWNFGDSTTGSGDTNTHTYAAAGTYNVTLTVTDNRGGQNVISHPVTVVDPPPNILPTASFTSIATYHTATFTSTSTDQDGTIASTLWDFGDTSTGSGTTTSHTYSSAGTYTVSLTVTDDRGGISSVSQPVTVTDEYATDTFERAVTGGLGRADQGGDWTPSGAPESFSVANGVGQIDGVAGANRAAYLTTVHQTDIDTKADVALDRAATGGGAYVSLSNRRVSNGNDYRLKLRYLSGGAVTAYLTRTVGGTETVLASTTVPGLTLAPDDVLRVRFQTLGTSPTALHAKVWRYGTQEPPSWLLTGTDSTPALAAPGDIGIVHYVSGSWTGTAPDLIVDNLRSEPDTGPPVNVPPTAAFTTGVNHLSASFDATGSTDADFGTISSYLWNFGDSTTGTGATNTHTYAAEGTYTVTLTVTDNDGATDSISHAITVQNIPPVPSFTPETQDHTATLTSTSNDPDGTIVDSAWDFGDGTTGTGAIATHTYAAAGTYTVTLTVTDNNGASASTSNPVTVTDPAANLPPSPSFSSSVQFHTATLTSTSTDSDGTIVDSAWDFGDGTTGSGVTNQHTYASPGTYTVTLTVTDDDGDTGTATGTVVVTNTDPGASFTSSAQDLTATLTSTSSDPDGTITSYAWDFGDGTTGTGAVATHTYATAGTYVVGLTVTDNDGGTNFTSQPVTMADQYVADLFGRTVTNGFGTADLGGAWTLSGAAASFSVDGSAGNILGAVGSNRSAFLAAVHQIDFDTKVDLRLDRAATGGGAYASVVNRRVSNGNDYRLKLRYAASGSVTASLTRTVGGTESVLSSIALPGLTVAPGDTLRTRFQAIGTNPTTLKAKVWPQSSVEPTAWMVTTTDSTAALAAPGDIGVLAYVSGSWTGTAPTLSIDNLVAGADSGAPGNVAPTASFTSSSLNHTATLTSSSTDPDGTIVSTAWDFGDGTNGTGPTNDHTYTTAGTYTVTLTVTDDGGATSSVSQPVTVTNAPPAAEFTADAAGHTATLTSTSTDPDGSIVSTAWDFGDTTTGTGAATSHIYATAGTYTVTLTVTDNDGATASANQQVTITDPPPNIPPVASFTASTQGRTATLTSTSTDPDGSIVFSLWDFGDSTTAAGVAPTHLYTSAGTYTVTLTVTDNDGATDSVSQQVVVTDLFAADLFERTVANGLGTADVGGAWTLSGTAASFSVTGGAGHILGTVSANRAAYLSSVHQTDVELKADVSLNVASSGGGAYASLIGRRVSNGNDFRLKLRYAAGGAITAYLTRTVGGTETVLSSISVSGLTVNPGDVLRLRFQVTGTSPTTVRAKVWRQSDPEPAAWLLTSTDSTAALAAPGDIGVLEYVSGSWTGTVPTVTIDNLGVTSPAGA